MARRKKEAEDVKKLADDVDSKEQEIEAEDTPSQKKSKKEAKYLALGNIKDNGKRFKKGDHYDGPNADSLLKSGAIEEV